MHFLDISQLTAEQILEIFELTDQLRYRSPEPYLQEKR